MAIALVLAFILSPSSKLATVCRVRFIFAAASFRVMSAFILAIRKRWPNVSLLNAIFPSEIGPGEI